MRGVGNAAAHGHGAHELDKEIYHDKQRRPDGDDTEYIHDGARIEDGEEEHDAVYRAGSAYKDGIDAGSPVREEAHDTCSNPSQQIEEQELIAADLARDRHAEHIEGQHVHQQMPDAAMAEHIGGELPVCVAVEHG